MESTGQKSKGGLLIEQLMSQLDPGSERFGVLQTARRFKSSWVELGEKLLAVQGRALFKEWGYNSFEDYCSREIRIKQPTAQKLTLAYRYLEKEEPEVLQRQHDVKPLPDFRAVDLLRQARDDQSLSTENFSALRQAVMDEGLSPPTVRKRLRDISSATGSPGLQTQKEAAIAALQALQKRLAALPELQCRHQSNLALLLNELQQLPHSVNLD